MTALSAAGRRSGSSQTGGEPLRASGNLRRRMAVSRTLEVAATAAALFAVAMLVDVAVTVVKNGAPAINFAFLTQSANGLAGGGIANALIGTGIMVAFGALMAIPLGILVGLFLTEVASPRSRLAHVLEVVLDMLQGVPTVVVGVVVFGLIVVPQGKETGFAGAIALAIIMLPLIARASQQVLALIPSTFREAADALGVDRWRTAISVILPTAAGGILTGAILAVARAAGETAPLLLVDSLYHPNTIQLQPFGNGVPSVPMFIYTTYDLPSTNGITLAWGAALVLLTCILVANVGARLLLARTRRRMGL